MKVCAFLFSVLFSTLAFAGPMKDADGVFHDDAPTRISSGGVLWAVPNADWLVENAGWSYPSQADVYALAKAQAQAAIDAEAERIDGKSIELKQAENAFLTALYGYNAAYALGLTADDSFQSAMQKLKDSTTGERIDRIEAGLTLRTLWDVVLFHGGRWGDTQFHEGVQP